MQVIFSASGNAGMKSCPWMAKAKKDADQPAMVFLARPIGKMIIDFLGGSKSSVEKKMAEVRLRTTTKSSTSSVYRFLSEGRGVKLSTARPFLETIPRLRVPSEEAIKEWAGLGMALFLLCPDDEIDAAKKKVSNFVAGAMERFDSSLSRPAARPLNQQKAATSQPLSTSADSRK